MQAVNQRQGLEIVLHLTSNFGIEYSFEYFNPLIGTLKPQSNGPLYSNTVIDTLAVDE